MALVNAVEAQEVSGWSSSSSRLFVVPDHHGNVVAKGNDSAATDVDLLGDDILLSQEASKFQMGVVDVTIRVVGGHQACLNVGWELSPPEQGRDVGVSSGGEPDATHASTRGIMSTHSHRVIRNELSNLRGTVSKGVSQVFEVIKHVTHGRGDSNAVLIGVAQAFLQKGEESTGARNTNGHTAQFSKDLVPEFEGNPMFEAERVKQVLEALNAVRGELEGLPDSIDEPPQNNFAGAQVGITLKKFFHGRDMLAVVGIVLINWMEDGVDGVEKSSEMVEPGGRVALTAQNKIINKDIGVTNRFGKGPQDRRCWGRRGCRRSDIPRRGLRDSLKGMRQRKRVSWPLIGKVSNSLSDSTKEWGRFCPSHW